MHEFLKEVEGAFVQMAKIASAVVEGPTSEKLRCKWIAEVEVNIMAKIRRAALSTAGPPRAQNRPAALLGSIVLSPTSPHN